MSREIKFVYVLDKDGSPLMPTRRFGKVRRMLKLGLAKVVGKDVFTIQLCYEPETHEVQNMTLGCDTGYEHIGLSAGSSKYEYYSEETIIDNGMKKRLETRRSYRRDRRNRKCRYRKPRFLNRISSKKDGWLAPSVCHRRDTHINRINFICKILPVKHIVLELALFDTLKLKNPDIEGVEYQQGDTLGYENKRQFVLARDKFNCQNCKGKSGSKKLQVHHIKWKSKGGTDDVNNLITLCDCCHTMVHKGEIVLKNKRFKTFVEAAGVSSMKTSLVKMLKEIHSDKSVDITFGYITKFNRKKHNIKKSHNLDAFAIAKQFSAEQLDYHYVCLQRKRHERSTHVKTFAKHGIRRSNIAPKYIKNTYFRKSDYVLYRDKRAFISGSSNGYPVLKDINMKKIHKEAIVSVKKIRLIRHQQGLYLVDIVRN